ncbi:VOC family protein [Acinetobacter bereziniae]|uniref:VOC family protein n=1 Tax=Acinetobacter bereziniae TaxID=106648 RepID=UPI000EF72A87|nr:VOC family protein [Acinetobacter bereziniae]MBJ8421938.1 VOC family protein [Acinetobacter bereziniae]MCU4474309.1 VOC family protein [Acinetobacter bereziniae]MCU4543653.1 VOC family protein [Acinetobacter bereziniae]MCU4626222.1 VOC family protein [Acinetobacter bereziniae]
MQLNHYLNFEGQTEAAFNFYKSVFGGDFSFLKRYSELPDVQVPEQEKNYILHISLPINDFTVLMGSDTTEQFCAPNSAPFSKGTNHYISINLEAHEADEAQRLFTALSANGQIEMALDKTFWGALYGAFTDQFGIRWMVNCQLNEI